MTADLTWSETIDGCIGKQGEGPIIFAKVERALDRPHIWGVSFWPPDRVGGVWAGEYSSALAGRNRADQLWKTYGKGSA